MLLAGDIGGTHTRFAFLEGKRVVCFDSFSSRDFPSFVEVLRAFCKKHPNKTAAACFAIAGPVRDGVVDATNLPWHVNREEVQREFGIERVLLCNDLLANAKGIDRGKCLSLQMGKPRVGNCALLSPGTGLGEAGMFWDGRELHPFASEGGHADFAPMEKEEVELLEFLQKKFGHVSYERVLSGPGIENIYQFLGEKRGFQEGKCAPEEVCKRALQKDPLCREVIEIFLRLCGREAGNLALKMLAVGGIYLGGGILPHLVEILQKSSFLKAFSSKGRFRSLLEEIPIFLVQDDKTALLGAAAFAGELL